MAVSTANPYGAVGLLDGGTPRVITVRAVTNISGGYWVTGSGVAGAASLISGADSLANGDITGYAMTANVTSSGVMGVALQDIASGADGPCAMRGVFIMPAGSSTVLGSVVKGCPVAAYGLGGVIGSSTLSFDCYVARALTDAGGAANEFCAVSVNA